MSALSQKISYIRAATTEALQTNDPQKFLDVLAPELTPMLNVLDRYAAELHVFGELGNQRWAMKSLTEACNDFGVEPPVVIT